MSFTVEMWSRRRVDLSRCIVYATIWWSTIFGALPYGYNRQRKRLVQTCYSLIYSTLVDLLLIALSLRRFYREIIGNWNDVYEWSLTMLLTELYNLAGLGGLLAILWTNWKEYDSLLAMFNEFVALERGYFARHKYLTDNCATFHNYLACKAFVVLFNNIVILYVTYDDFGRISFYMFLAYVIRAILFKLLMLPAFQFYTAVLLIYRNIWILQQRLQYLASCGERRLHIDNLSHEIAEIVGVYMRLQRLCEQCNRIYGKQVLLYIGGIVSENISTTFVLMLIWKAADHSWYMLYVAYEIVFNIVEFWLLITACQLTLNAAHDLSQLLRSFNDCAPLDGKAAHELEIVALICATHKPRFRLCSLMNLDYSSGLGVLLTIVLHLVYLVQMNYVIFNYPWRE